MSYPSGPRDPLVESLNPLVIRGALSPTQADEVYRAISSGAALGGKSSDETSGPGWERPRLLAGIAVFGASLLLAALSIGSSNAENVPSQVEDFGGAASGFPGKAFTAMLLITLFFAAAAAVSHLLASEGRYFRLVTSVLAGFSLLAFGVTVVSTWDQKVLVYLVAILLLVGGLVGYWLLSGEVWVPVAVLGGVILLGQVLSDTLDDSDLGPGTVLTAGMLFLVYGLVVAAAGWRFGCRQLAAMLGGAIALAAMWLTVLVIGLGAYFFGLSAETPGVSTSPLTPPSIGDVRTDMRIAMVLGLLVALGLVLLYAYTSYSGYLVLAFLGAVSLPSTTVGLTHGQHPLRWAIAFAVVGAVAAALPVAFHGRRLLNRRARPSQPGAPPGYSQHG